MIKVNVIVINHVYYNILDMLQCEQILLVSVFFLTKPKTNTVCLRKNIRQILIKGHLLISLTSPLYHSNPVKAMKRNAFLRNCHTQRAQGKMMTSIAVITVLMKN